METTSLSEQQHRMKQDRATLSGKDRDPPQSDTDPGNEQNAHRRAKGNYIIVSFCYRTAED